MRKKLLLLALLTAAFAAPARAQFIGYTAPQTVTAPIFSAQSTATRICTGGSVSSFINIGQNVHFLSFTLSNTSVVYDLRMEGANVAGGPFFPISADSIDGFSLSGILTAVGYYPEICVNLVAISGGTITASYAGTSSAPGVGYGAQNPSDQIRKTVFVGIGMGFTSNTVLGTPYGSTQGYFIVTSASGSFPSGSTVTFVGFVGTAVSVSLSTFNLAVAGAPQIFAVPGGPATSMAIQYNSGGASANTFSGYFLATNPGVPSGLNATGIQPLTTFNSETTSAANTAITKSILGGFGQRVSLFSVSARCSAGTASLTVKDGVAGTTIWSTGAAEVGTTTFKFPWNPGLASSLGNGMDIVLSTCGASNTGTLDVQASQN